MSCSLCLKYTSDVPLNLFSSSFVATEPKLLNPDGVLVLCHRSIKVPIWQINWKQNQINDWMALSGEPMTNFTAMLFNKKKKKTKRSNNDLGLNPSSVVWPLNDESHVVKRVNKMNKSKLKRQFVESNHWIIVILIKCLKLVGQSTI